ncbi:MAG: DNA-3-methyladenine glycosylase [Alphaproteobacteria bacterium]|jgi:DNA-3-methyladenine glycosylase II|nr:DNA-3-methyladenine glycosylase [Alphaproteobacteria bacterium]MDP6567980.1 DNA-3-methyladenine glycosylase [Alphaproteobacteria bacterium]MDP6815445.1 DNA-3-methyladenine glycosylase [Alphaproteobacteria bacterium]
MPERPLEVGFRQVAALDSRLAGVLERHGQPRVRSRPGGFETLLKIIVEQQVSVASAEAIWKRLRTGLGRARPGAVLAHDEEQLRGYGLSRQKAHYVRQLAEAVDSGRLSFRRLVRMDDEAAIEALVQVKGIGRWTAEVYLLAAMRRPDVMPCADLALMEAARDLLGLDERPTAKEMALLAEDWRPWRTYAARLLWHHYRHAKGRETAA